MNAFLRTLQGQAALFGLTTVLAIVLGGVLATQTTYFESYVVQKYAEPTVSEAAVAAAVVAGTEPLTDAIEDSVYATWMQASGAVDLGALSDEDVDRVRALVVRTVVSGTPEQRVTAVRLWRQVGSQDLVLDEARAYARRLGRDDVLDALDAL
jgi:hypothetical protein